MRFSSLFVASLAIACGLSGTAMSQTDATTALPDVVVGAQKQVARPQKPEPRAVERSTVSPRTSAANPPGGCVHGEASMGGCVTSFKSGDRPWVGCSWSGIIGVGCRNIGPGGVPFRTYNQCMETGKNAGWRTNESAWYCTSIALKD
jgi:hypothetical protein